MIHCGDLFDVLPTLDAESIDSGVTDPPYGIGFMGKQWDTFKPGESKLKVKANTALMSENPNLKNRQRSPATSPSAVAYDRSLRGQHEFQSWTESWAREVLRVLKPGAHLLVCGAPRSYHRMASGLEDAGFEIRDCLCWLFGQGFPKSLNVGDGRGTALKPAHEPIVIARKPFKGSVTANLEKYGAGALNIDACRVGDDTSRGDRYNGKAPLGGDGITTAGAKFDEPWEVKAGRWPANVLLDEDAAEMLDEMSGQMVDGVAINRNRPADIPNEIYGKGWKHSGQDEGFGGSGGASRFFYVAKPSRRERDEGIYDLAERSGADNTGCADGSRGLIGDPGPRGRTSNPRANATTGRNFHPTVKPLELMRWLVRLVTPPQGRVLDPFAGSGTTGMACAFEFCQFIGIEREAEYVEIAKRRIAACNPLFADLSVEP